MTESMHRVLTAPRLPRSTPALLRQTRAILVAMEASPHFPAPTPAMAAVAAALAELDDAQTTTLSRTRGTLAARDEKRAALMVCLRQLQTEVQRVADANPESAVSIIESAGMSVKRRAVQTKPPFAVKEGRVSGSVVLAVLCAGDRASYQWQWSLDGGVTWRGMPVTMQAKTELTGLAAGQVCWFRVRTTTRHGEGNWSAPRELLVT
jgi:hypothetical protein